LNIVVTSLAERGGQIFTTTVNYGDKSYIYPDLNTIKRKLSISYINNILGTNMNIEKAINSLNKMGYDISNKNSDEITVEIPAWRSDFLHDIDLVEDVAVGYGFEKFESKFPHALTFGRILPQNDILNGLRNIMIGLGFNEVTTFTISNEKDEFIKMGLKKGIRAELENPIGEDYTCMRISLIPSILKILNENRHHSLPQQIFELGITLDNSFKNRYNLTGMKIDAKANFTECKSIIEAIMRGLGLNFNIENLFHPGFVKGRCASIIFNDKDLGFFGELHPKIITNFNLEYPIIAFELKIDNIKHILQKKKRE
jgi:phenylalanyl-tRNA synthetase beta chain